MGLANAFPVSQPLPEPTSLSPGSHPALSVGLPCQSVAATGLQVLLPKPLLPNHPHNSRSQCYILLPLLVCSPHRDPRDSVNTQVSS